MEDHYSVKEVAKILGIHEETVRRYLREDRVSGEKFGNSWVIHKDQLDILKTQDLSQGRPVS